MIGYLKGEITKKTEGGILIETHGVGYEVNMAPSSIDSLSNNGKEVKVHIIESISPYDGTILYGFASSSEKELFKLLKQSVPNTGPKKALEYLNKALKSLPDFYKAISTQDNKLLTGIFGFTTKTADKLINALKEKVSSISVSGDAKIHIAGQTAGGHNIMKAFEALNSLGYSNSETKRVIERLHKNGIKENASVEDIIKQALREMAK
jgi:holliday junction DNA helicase RuvA